MFPEQISASNPILRFCKRSSDDQKANTERAIYREKQGPAVRIRLLLFVPIACNSSLLFLLSDLRGVCILGLQLVVGAVANNFGVIGIVIFGTTGLLVELLLGFFIVFLALALGLLFGFLLFLGRGGLCFLRGRGFV